jgi:hypothetical protein
MLDDARQGELLGLLFRTFFRQLDLRTLDGAEGDDGLQQTIGFTLWRLRSEAKEWTTPAHLADVAWLESAKDPDSPNSVWKERELHEWRFRRRVVEPLVLFGLLESRDLPAENKWEHPIEVRKAPLFDRLLRFDFR